MSESHFSTTVSNISVVRPRKIIAVEMLATIRKVEPRGVLDVSRCLNLGHFWRIRRMIGQG